MSNDNFHENTPKWAKEGKDPRIQTAITVLNALKWDVVDRPAGKSLELTASAEMAENVSNILRDKLSVVAPARPTPSGEATVAIPSNELERLKLLGMRAASEMIGTGEGFRR